MNNLERIRVREQEPSVRAKNFDEVCFGYDIDEAIGEAQRCLSCKNAPCAKGCPVGIDIPSFIKRVKEGDVEGAYLVISQNSSLPAICGRVCPQESQCEGKCVRGIKGEPIAIGKLERFCADYATERGLVLSDAPSNNGIKVAVIGSGPSGLACAGDLRKLGYDVTVFEALHEFGGVLTYGIPEFRLPKEKVVKKEIEKLAKSGVKFEKNAIAGKSFTVDELFEKEGFSAAFLGVGAGLPKFMNIPGENAKGVFSANEFLTRVNLMKAYSPDADTPVFLGKNTVVVGGGNVAMDAARTALRLGSKVRIVYRRGEEELPARKEEVFHAKEEGVEFTLLTNPTEILRDENDNVIGVKVVKMELGEPDASGRRRPREVVGSEYVIEADAVIMSLGTSANPNIASLAEGMELTKYKFIVADENGKTTKDGVYAGGDAVTGAATVILAMGAGKAAAKSIDAYLKEKSENDRENA